jgi:choline dehydrogenase-like flavoprotein
MTQRTERVDVCIIGSGAGGSVIAHEAARRGLSTLVLERGPRVSPADLKHDELEMIPRLYKHGGMQLNASLDLFILQGSCVGGSTVLSNMVMMRPDDSVFAAWSRAGAEHSLEALTPHFDAVAHELEVDWPSPSNVSQSAWRFKQAAERLGLTPEWMSKALGACRGCGYCNVGCTFGTKRDASATYLRWAEQHGARVLADARVLRVRHRAGRATSVDVRVGRQAEQLHVNARVVVVAAGAIGSSGLLLQSGIRRNVGQRLSFNAGGMVVAEFDEVLDAYDADQMTVSLRGPGYVIEVTHNPPMSAALTTPGWLSQHARLMARSRQLAYAGPLVATEAVGEVVLSRLFGHEQTRFRMTQRDLTRLKHGMRTIAQVFFEAGAKRVFLPTHTFHALSSPHELSSIDDAFHDMNEVSVGSAHPQGGNPISSDPQLGAVDNALRVHGFENLFVCDASVFPSCIGVNPIHTIMALAKQAAPGIMAEA